MAVAAAAALLDELMGRSRNDGSAIKKKKIKWEDPEVMLKILVAGLGTRYSIRLQWCNSHCISPL